MDLKTGPSIWPILKLELRFCLRVINSSFVLLTTIDDYWKEWKNVSDCSVTCGEGGTIKQKRECQPPTGLGANCVGNETQHVPCNYTIPCPGKHSLP